MVGNISHQWRHWLMTRQLMWTSCSSPCQTCSTWPSPPQSPTSSPSVTLSCPRATPCVRSLKWTCTVPAPVMTSATLNMLEIWVTVSQDNTVASEIISIYDISIPHRLQCGSERHRAHQTLHQHRPVSLHTQGTRLGEHLPQASLDHHQLLAFIIRHRLKLSLPIVF